MNKKIIAVAALAFLCLGYVAANAQGAGDYSRTPAPAVSTGASKAVGTTDLFFDPLTPDPSALPGGGVLPVPANLRDNETPRRYTGIIKNKTRYEVSLPSENSDGTLVIPPHSWIEYTMWTRRANVTAYHDGKPFYCLKLYADPREYPFMCEKYDFMAEIVKPEPAAGKYKPMKKRQRRVKKQPQV
ncbi:MAG: hypothetical protein KKD99_08235 [Proteobacteria bacterium]|nr:hypothetical protein [Pseudomonadota bacterium]MBU4448560.1 hypothetical protein [Pseudomonadota bacterium]MCG2773425.1 hypothetical protein [Desulfobacterales bacterium]